MQNRCIILTVGLPATGKTTLCKAILQNLPSSYSGMLISFDDFLHHLGTDGTDTLKKQRNQLVQFLDLILEDMNSKDYSFKVSSNYLHINFPENVQNFSFDLPFKGKDSFIFLLDDNMFYYSMRQPFRKLARKHNTGLGYLSFQAPLEVIIQRNLMRADENQVKEETIYRMSAILEELNDPFNFILNTTVAISYGEIFNFFEKCLKHPMHKQPDETIIQPQSKIHQVDIQLRKEINRRVMEKFSNEERKHLADDLNQRRKAFLIKLRHEINIPKNSDIYKIFD